MMTRRTGSFVMFALAATFAACAPAEEQEAGESGDELSTVLAKGPSPEDRELEKKGTPQPESVGADGADEDYTGSRFSDVWAAVKSDSYKELPHYSVTLTSFGLALGNRIRQATKRTVSDHSDLLPKFRKLIRPNGVCFTGTWKIDQENPYSGYFKKGSEALVVARASVGLTATERGKNRSFGMAAKLFPTADPADAKAYHTANFFVIDDNGGTKKGSFLDDEGPRMSNWPPFNPKASVQTVVEFGVLVATKVAQSLADKESGQRQLYMVSELGESKGASIRTPHFINIYGLTKSKAEKADFRDELRMSNQNGPIRLAIDVGDEESSLKRVGELTFTESVTSDSCDHSLHFYHPRYRSDMK